MARNSNDLGINLKLTLEEMYSGITKKIKYKRNIPCSGCNNSKECPTCAGRGLVLSESIEELKIPEGVGSGMQLKFKNKGHFYIENKGIWKMFSNRKNKAKSTFGSLIVTIEEIKHDVFSRDGSDLIYQCRIRQSDLKKADKVIEIPHLDKEIIKVQIPKNISDGKILRIQGKGFKNIAENTIGSLLIKVNVVNDN